MGKCISINIKKFIPYLKVLKIKICYEMGMIGDWGLGIGDWGLGVWGLGPSPKTQTPNPQTQNPHPP